MQTKAALLRALENRLDGIDEDFEEIQRRVEQLERRDAEDVETTDGQPDVDPIERLESERDVLQKKIDRLERIGDDSWQLLTGEVSEALTSLTVNMVATKERLEARLDD